MDTNQADRAEAQLRAGVYGRLSESVPTQLDRGTDHAARRDWAVVATFKDDGYSAFKEITRDGFAVTPRTATADFLPVARSVT